LVRVLRFDNAVGFVPIATYQQILAVFATAKQPLHTESLRAKLKRSPRTNLACSGSLRPQPALPMPPSRNDIRNDIPAAKRTATCPTCPTCLAAVHPIRRQRYSTPPAGRPRLARRHPQPLPDPAAVAPVTTRRVVTVCQLPALRFEKIYPAPSEVV
jgi:hypothetical protein